MSEQSEEPYDGTMMIVMVMVMAMGTVMMVMLMTTVVLMSRGMLGYCC